MSSYEYNNLLLLLNNLKKTKGTLLFKILAWQYAKPLQEVGRTKEKVKKKEKKKR